MTTTPREPSRDQRPIEDAAELIREKLDQWLDRVVDQILATPRPGSPAWHQAWRERATPAGHAAHRRRLLTRIAVAHRAGIDPTPDIRRALAAGIPPRDLPTPRTGTRTSRPRRATGSTADQFTLF